MSEQIDIDINVNMNNATDVDELTSKLEAATAEVERLEEALAEAELNGDDIEADAIADELAAATEEAESLQAQLDEIDNTTVEPEVNPDDSGLDETKEKMEDIESSASSLTTALGGIAGVMGVDQMISGADRINTSYKQLELTFADTDVSIKTLTARTGELSSATGRSGSQVREYFNQMGIAGITNVDSLSASFESLAGFAAQSGLSLEGMESKIQKMVITGNASKGMLSKMGLSYKDLADAMGVTEEEAKATFEALDPQGRLDALTQAMGDGKEANDMYKDSYVGLKAQAEQAMNGLLAAVGQGALPVITPLLKGATDIVKGFTNTFKSLPGPVQGAVGGIAGFLAIGTATIGTLGVVGQVGKGVTDGLKSMKSGYDTVKGAMGTAKTMMDALRNSESITEGVRAALAIATGAEATAEGAGAAAKTAATGPTMGLAIAENSLLLPLLLIVGAVIAVVAVMWYLYNTNETVRNGINWLVSQIQAFINQLVPAAQGILDFVTNGISYISQLPGKIWSALLLALAQVTLWRLQLIQYGINAAKGFINNVRSALSGIGSAVSSALSGVFNAMIAPFKQAYDYINNNVIQPLQNAWNTVSSLFSGFEGYEGYGDYGDYNTLNSTLTTISSNTNRSNLVVNNNFNGLVEESAADYIVNAVNDRLRREKLLKGA